MLKMRNWFECPTAFIFNRSIRSFAGCPIGPKNRCAKESLPPSRYYPTRILPQNPRGFLLC